MNKLLDLLDFDTLTDTDLHEMMDREIPCEWSQLLRERGVSTSWCTETATRWVRLTCRKCGKGGRLLACPPCATMLYRGLKIMGVVMGAWIKHEGCRRPNTFRVRTGEL